MSSLTQVFMYHSTQVRTVTKDGQPWFVASDVCAALELGNTSAAVGRLDQDEKGLIPIDTLGGQQSVICVNEPGLYELILGSRKKEAKDFKRWVKHEVLPSIRKHGAYMTPDTIEKTLTDPDFIIGLANTIKEERTKRLAAEAKIEADRPKVLFAESLQISQDSVLVADLAKLLKQNGVDMGERRLFQWLRENGYLIKSGSEYNMPTQRSMEMKLFEVRVSTRQGSDGTPRLQRTPKVTGRGQIYFVNKFKQQETA